MIISRIRAYIFGFVSPHSLGIDKNQDNHMTTPDQHFKFYRLARRTTTGISLRVSEDTFLCSDILIYTTMFSSKLEVPPV
jgi:hypothetical protein